jgi:DNA-directed RNA polymerase alpha subunit
MYEYKIVTNGYKYRIMWRKRRFFNKAKWGMWHPVRVPYENLHEDSYYEIEEYETLKEAEEEIKKIIKIDKKTEEEKKEKLAEKLAKWVDVK